MSAIEQANNGTLTYTTTGNLGVATISVSLRDDGGTTNGGLDTSNNKAFTIIFGNDIFSNGFE